MQDLCPSTFYIQKWILVLKKSKYLRTYGGNVILFESTNNSLDIFLVCNLYSFDYNWQYAEEIIIHEAIKEVVVVDNEETPENDEALVKVEGDREILRLCNSDRNHQGCTDKGRGTSPCRNQSTMQLPAVDTYRYEERKSRLPGNNRRR